MKKNVKFTLCILVVSVGLFAVRWGAVSILKYYDLMFRAWIEKVFSVIMVLLGLALSGGIVYTLFKASLSSQDHMRKKALFQIGINAVLIVTAVSGILVMFIWSFSFKPEHIAEKHNHKMVAYVSSLLDVNVEYHEYINAFVCGYGVIGNEWYGNGDYDPFERNPIPVPKTYKFFDTQGNLIAQSEEKAAASKKFAFNLPILPEPSADEQEIVIESEKVEINTLDFNVAENRDNELVFTISIEDFISSYNGFYWSDHESRYLSPSSEWVCFTYDSTAHSDYETYYYRFKEDEKIWSLPEISIYVPTDNNNIQEITLDFDDHGYTEPNYRLYEEICFYTLKVLFPDFENGKITDVYNALYDKTNDPRCLVRTGEPTPKVLYYANDIGLYSFYRGGMAHICIIPITKPYLDKLASQKVEIHNIDNEF